MVGAFLRRSRSHIHAVSWILGVGSDEHDGQDGTDKWGENYEERQGDFRPHVKTLVAEKFHYRPDDDRTISQEW